MNCWTRPSVGVVGLGGAAPRKLSGGSCGPVGSSAAPRESWRGPVAVLSDFSVPGTHRKVGSGVCVAACDVAAVFEGFRGLRGRSKSNWNALIIPRGAGGSVCVPFVSATTTTAAAVPQGVAGVGNVSSSQSVSESMIAKLRFRNLWSQAGAHGIGGAWKTKAWEAGGGAVGRGVGFLPG